MKYQLRIKFFVSALLITLAVFLAITCGQSDPEAVSGGGEQSDPSLVAETPLLQLLDAAQTGISFQNNIVETYEDNISNNINKYNGGGLAVGDFNNDQKPDLFFIKCNGKNALYLNEGNLKFRDITDQAGLGETEGFETAATLVDINADGWLDIYICRGGVEINDFTRNRLFINNQNLTFSEKSHEYGLDDPSASTGANFFDADNDGDLDCYILNYPAEDVHINRIESKLSEDGKRYIPQLFPKKTYDSDRFYRNDNGKFTDISQKSGVWNLGYGLSVSVSDFNFDGFTDVYVANDFIQPDLLYINNGNLTFSNQITQYFSHCTQQTMGTDINDFNNDGLVDLFSVDMLAATNVRRKSTTTITQALYTAMVQNGYFEPVIRNTLQRNNGNGSFSDVGCMAGVFKTDWSWSGLLFDIDNDGLRDLHISNGYRREVTNRDFIDFVMPEIREQNGKGNRMQDIYPNINDFLKLMPSYKVRNFCYQNKGDLNFDDVSGKWLTMHGSWSCGTVWSDLDLDGDLDLVVNNLEQPAFVYQNLSRDQNKGNYLQIKLQGSSANPFAVGASVLIEYNNGQVQYQELYPTRGIFSSVEHLIHFGLGQTSTIDKLTVRWPDGKTQILSQVNANQRLTLKHSDASGYLKHLHPTLPQPRYFEAISGLSYAHSENENNDFEQFPLNTWRLTDLGPLMVSGDVNGDGLDDVFIGNSFDKSAVLLAQQTNGTFKPIAQQTWETDKLYEDHGACFFDADRDGDLDLYVVSGGMESTSPQAWTGRLYINMDAKGNFVNARGAIPQTSDIGLRVAPMDYDNDGDFDLFIGGRVTPGKWPLTPRSTVLRNDRNRFVDATAEIAPDFEKCGMVTDLQWTNIDSDPMPELVVCGEWMPIMIFEIEGGKLVNRSSNFGLEKSNGLWHRLCVADLDKDGDQDIITGNWGFNTRYVASDDAPFTCYAADFDKNGILDPIVGMYEQDKLFPIVQRDVLVKHIPSLKKKYLKAKDYSVAKLSDIYPEKDLNNALHLQAFTLATCWWENQNGKMIRHELPREAQMSVVQGIIADDFTNDGHIDLLMAGNKYGVEVETYRCDAGNGVLLAGDGKGNFKAVSNLESGFWAQKEARDLALLKGANGSKFIVVSNNNGPAQLYRWKRPDL